MRTGWPPPTGTTQTGSSWVKANHWPSGDHWGGSSIQYEIGGRSKVSRSGHPPMLGMRYRSDDSSRSQKKAMAEPSADRLALRGRLMDTSSEWLQPSGGGRAGRGCAGQPRRRYFSVSRSFGSAGMGQGSKANVS